jgi:hypothetical protein
VSDRQSCPEPSGAQFAEATAWEDPEALTCLASATLSTYTVRKGQSRPLPVGRRQATTRRRHGLRRRFPPRQLWADDLDAKAIARGHDHAHATRILARAWVHIIWRCWQDGVTYDPAKHDALQRLQRQRLGTGLLMPLSTLALVPIGGCRHVCDDVSCSHSAPPSATTNASVSWPPRRRNQSHPIQVTRRPVGATSAKVPL